MRVNNNNQTSFGMKEVLVIGNPATKGFAKLTRLVEESRSPLMEMGDRDTYLLVGKGEGWGGLNVCAVTGCENVKTGASIHVTGKRQDNFILNPAKGLYELTNSALSRIRVTFAMYLNEAIGYRKTGIDLTKEQLGELYKSELDTAEIIAHDIEATARRQALGEHLIKHGSYARGTRK